MKKMMSFWVLGHLNVLLFPLQILPYIWASQFKIKSLNTTSFGASRNSNHANSSLWEKIFNLILLPNYCINKNQFSTLFFKAILGPSWLGICPILARNLFSVLSNPLYPHNAHEPWLFLTSETNTESMEKFFCISGMKTTSKVFF